MAALADADLSPSGPPAMEDGAVVVVVGGGGEHTRVHGESGGRSRPGSPMVAMDGASRRLTVARGEHQDGTRGSYTALTCKDLDNACVHQAPGRCGNEVATTIRNGHGNCACTCEHMAGVSRGCTVCSTVAWSSHTMPMLQVKHDDHAVASQA